LQVLEVAPLLISINNVVWVKKVRHHSNLNTVPKSLLCFSLFFAVSFGATSQGTFDADSWSEVLRNKSGSITVTWYTSTPFIYHDNQGELAGIEYEILVGFQKYLKRAHNVSLNINWWENKSFSGTYEMVRTADRDGLLGVSAFSITEKRQTEVAFAPPYMSDISVMISSYDVPIVTNVADFGKVFNGLKAVTIEGTTYAEDLEALKVRHNLTFDIEYIPSHENIQQAIAGMNGAFGFIDLPIYLTEFSKNSSLRIKRQNLFPIKRVGYAVIIPRESDWSVPLEEYLLSNSFQTEKDAIIGKYLDWEVYDFVKSLYTSGNEDIFLLTREKEIQNEALLGITEQIRREAILRNFLIGGVIIILVSLVVITRLYIIRHRTTQTLHLQTQQIESQRQDIAAQKMTVERHNKRLIDLNDEKNHLINILAHDLRAPINQIAGLAQVLLIEKEMLTGGQQETIENMLAAATRLGNMIGRILDTDSIEGQQEFIPLEPVSLDRFMKDAIDRFMPEATRKGIKLRFSPDGSCYIAADSMHLAQIVDNILSNALKFSPRGKDISVEIDNKGNSIDLRITDQGPGFTADDQKLMFRKFQRLSARPTGAEASTGLGLSIVKKYTMLMGASLGVDSEPGKGSTFIVTFAKYQYSDVKE
jgi:signal transduction histidine kinase